jgi:hypothetical protein
MAGQRALHDLLGLPDAKRIQAILPVGYINQARLSPRDLAPECRLEVFRNLYGSPCPFPQKSAGDAAER